MTTHENVSNLEGAMRDIPGIPMGPPGSLTPAQDQEVEIMRGETQMVTQRGLLLEAKAREMHGYFNLAKAFAKTSMVRSEYQWNGGEDPASMKPLHNLCAAMMYGAKLGIEAEDAGLLVITINNSPGLEAKTMVGIVRRWCDRRVAEGRTARFSEGGDWIWEVESDDDHCVWAARRDGNEVSCEWTMERAIRADTTTKDHQMKTRQGGYVKDMYGKYPIEMLRARAQSEVARIQFSDVLRGMQYSVEEQRLIERTVNRPVQVNGGKGAAALETALEQHAAVTTVQGEVVQPEVVRPEPSQVDSEQAPEPAQATAPPDEAQTATQDQGPANDQEPQPEYRVKLLQTMHILLTSDGKIADRDRKLRVLSSLVGHELTSSKQMTDDEVTDTIATLQTWKRGRVLGQNLLALLQGQPLVGPAPIERASMNQLKELRAVYKAAGLQGGGMLDHIAGVLGWSVENINDLSDVDVRECIAKLEGSK